MPSDSEIRQRTKDGERMIEIIEWTMLTRTQDSSEKSSAVQRKQVKPVIIDVRDRVYSVAFLMDGKHIVSGGDGGKIRRWCVEDGEEEGEPMDARGVLFNVAVSRDGRWIVSGTIDGFVMVWDANNHKKVTEFTGHINWVRAVDASPDGTRIATASNDKTALHLVTLHWRATTWPIETRLPLGCHKIFTRWLPRRDCQVGV